MLLFSSFHYQQVCPISAISEGMRQCLLSAIAATARPAPKRSKVCAWRQGLAARGNHGPHCRHGSNAAFRSLCVQEEVDGVEVLQRTPQSLQPEVAIAHCFLYRLVLHTVLLPGLVLQRTGMMFVARRIFRFLPQVLSTWRFWRSSLGEVLQRHGRKSTTRAWNSCVG